MISTSGFKNGMTIEIDGDVYIITYFQHVKPGKGGAFVRTKLKHLQTGSVIDRTFRAGEKVKHVHLEEREMQYLYQMDNLFCFMELDTYEQLTLNQSQLDGAEKFIKENVVVTALMHNDKLLGIKLPIFVELAVTHTEPGVKGDTAAGGNKPATLETGYVVQVPLFIDRDDIIRIDTRTGEYVERVTRSGE